MTGRRQKLTPEKPESGNEKNAPRVWVFDFGARGKAAHVHKAGTGSVRAGNKARFAGNRDAVRKLRCRQADRSGRRSWRRIGNRVDQRGIGHDDVRVHAGERRQSARCLLESLRSTVAVTIARRRRGFFRRAGCNNNCHQSRGGQGQKWASHILEMIRDYAGLQGESAAAEAIASRRFPKMRPSNKALPMIAPWRPVIFCKRAKSAADDTPPLAITSQSTEFTIFSTS